MKKLCKLKFNSEKLIENEDLLTLKGGYDGGAFYIRCYRYSPMGGDCFIEGNCWPSMMWCDLYCPGSYASLCV